MQPKDKGKRKPIAVKEVFSGEAIIETRMAFDTNLLRLIDVFNPKGSDEMIKEEDDEN